MINYEAIYDDNIDLFSEIYQYTAENNVYALSIILSNNPQLLHVPVYGGVGGNRSLLHRAADDGSVDVCNLLIELGIDVNISDDGGMTPLVDAAGNGNSDVVDFLLSKGALVDGLGEGVTTPLIEATKNGYIELVTKFLNKGSDINRLQVNFNQTALDTARIYKRNDITELLVKNGGISAQETIQFSNERGSGILEHIYDYVGMILSTKLRKKFDNNQIDLRVALIDKGKKFKLLFTIGGYQSLPQQEFMFCLPYNWPINNQVLMKDNHYSFPLSLLFELSIYKLNGNKIKDGFIIEKSDNQWNYLHWPENVDAFIIVDYCFPSQKERAETFKDEVTLFMLIPIKYPKSGKLSTKKLIGWIDKKRVSKWANVVFE